jgi:hypothetical protein
MTAENLDDDLRPTQNANISLSADLAEDLLRYGPIVGRDGRRTDADMPPDWPASFLIDTNNIAIAPGLSAINKKLRWARAVHAVSPDADNATDFSGAYLRETTAIMPGEVVLCVEENTGHVVVYIMLPTGDLARELRPPVLWRSGWARTIREYTSGCVALSRVQRVLRVCQQIVNYLRVQGLPNEHETMRYYMDIIEGISIEPVDLTEDSLLRSFDDWIFRTSAYVNADRNKILAVLAQALGLAKDKTKDPFAVVKSLERYGRYNKHISFSRRTDSDRITRESDK